MGLFWDLIQHGQISEARDHTASLERRVEWLETELERTNETLVMLLKTLEQRMGEDLDSDGRVG